VFHTRSPRLGTILAVALPIAVYAAASLRFRYRPQPPGVNGRDRSYRISSRNIKFFHDTSWYEDEEAKAVRQVAEEAQRLVRAGSRFVVLDVFLFNLHHTQEQGPFLPKTRQFADAFSENSSPRFVITDPLNTSYGTQCNKALKWLEDVGVKLCITDVRKTRDNNMFYAPLWRGFIQWFGTGDNGRLTNPLQKNRTTTVRAVLEAVNVRANHRKVLISQDEEGACTTMVTSSNFDDASSYFCNTALTIRDNAVANHYLEAERAVARMSGGDIPVKIQNLQSEGEPDSEVTPLMGSQIAESLIADLNSAKPGDRLWVINQFIAHRGFIDALVNASNRGVETVVVLDQNKMSFGKPKKGYPNQYVAQELSSRANLTLRWANTKKEENHNKFMLLERADECVITLGSANFTRRSLSNTVLEADVRVSAPADSQVCRDVMDYVRWVAVAPRSLPAQAKLRRTLLGYWFYRFQEATGSGTY
jgi:HKD family nuclease